MVGVSDTTWLGELIRLRDRAGNPATRKIADPAGVSHTTVADTFAGRRFPSLPTLLNIVRALDGDEAVFIDLWWRAESEERSTVDPTPSQRELLQAILDELVLIRKKLDTMSAD
jgi:hypothetical protein